MSQQPALPRKPWLALALLCLMSVASYLDRYILSLIAVPLSQSLRITDTQFGLLVGAGFGITYVLVGVPLATLLDRHVRVRIVAVGVAGWSLCTILSAFAPNYWALLALRSGVALGEACLTPAAISLIADLFPGRTTRPTAIFMAIAAIMGSGALVLGGATYQLAGLGTQWLEPWRGTLLLVGIPGLILAAIWGALVREPERLKVAQERSENSLLAALGFIWSRGSFFVPFLAGVALSSVGVYAYFTWIATVLIRSFGFTVAEAGYWQGTLGFFAALAGAALWPALMTALERRGMRAGLPIVVGLALVSAQLMMVLFSLTDSRAAILAVSALATMFFGAAGTLPVLAMQRTSPPYFHAKVVSFYVLTGTIVGIVGGPVIAAWLGEHIFSGPDAIRWALSLMGAVLAPVVALLLLLAARAYPRVAEGGRETASIFG